MTDNNDGPVYSVLADVSYEHCVDYIWGELSGLNLTDNLQSVAICNFPENFVTVPGTQK